MRAQPHILAEEETTTLQVLLQRVSTELDHLTLSVDELQVMLSPLLVDVVGDSRHLVADVQRLDALAQTLASLSTFVLGLGKGPGGGMVIDPTPIAGALPLHDLADRLCGRPVFEETEDFEMF